MSLWRILAYNVIIRYQNYHILLHKFSNFSFSFKVPLWGQKKSTFQNSTFSFLRWYKSAQKCQNMKKNWRGFVTPGPLKCFCITVYCRLVIAKCCFTRYLIPFPASTNTLWDDFQGTIWPCLPFAGLAA